MKCISLSQWWKKMFINRKGQTMASRRSDVARVSLAPLTLGVRVDSALSTGAGNSIASSRLIWVSPGGTVRPSKALTVVLCPN